MEHIRVLNEIHDLSVIRTHAFNLTNSLTLAHTLTNDYEFQCKLHEMCTHFPDTSWENFDRFWQWWQTNSIVWIKQLRQILIEYRNVGHDWRFSLLQKQRLQQYYDANKLLVNGLNIEESKVSQEVREEIEDSLLLPIADIEKYKWKNAHQKN